MNGSLDLKVGGPGRACLGSAFLTNGRLEPLQLGVDGRWAGDLDGLPPQRKLLLRVTEKEGCRRAETPERTHSNIIQQLTRSSFCN